MGQVGRVGLVARVGVMGPQASRMLILVSIASFALAVAMSFGATFSLHLGPVRLHGSDPWHPLLIAAITGWTGALVTRIRSTRYLSSIVGVAACATLVALSFVRSNANEYATGDASLLELYTLHAARGIWPLGPYSRFGWHHPGPMYFYLLAPLYAAGNFHFLALNVGAALINLTSLIVLLVTVARYAARSAVLCVPIALGIYVVRLTPMFVSAWNPHVVVLPIAALVAVSAALACGHLSLAALAILIGSFCAQTHIALIPTVVALWTFSFAAILLRVRSGEITGAIARKWLNVALWTLVVCWFLPVAEELVNRPGNLAAIMRFFLRSQQQRPFLESFHIWAQMVVGSLTNQLAVPRGWALPLALSGLIAALAVGQLVVLIVASVFAVRVNRRFEAALCAAGCLALIVALWSTTHIATAVEDHQVFWMSILGALNWAVLAGYAIEPLAERVAGWSPKRLALVVYPMLLVLVVYRPIQLLRVMHQNADKGDRISHQIRASADAIAFDMSSHGFRRAIIRSGASAWTEHAGVVLELYKRRTPIAVARESAFMFGNPLAVDGYESVQYVVHLAGDYEYSDREKENPLLLRLMDLMITRHVCTGPDLARPCLLIE